MRNPLFGISSTLDAMEARLGAREEYQRYLRVLRPEVERLARLMRHLLDYGQAAASEVSPARVEDVLDEAVLALDALARRGEVAIVRSGSAGAGEVLVDRERLLQALQNVIENAIHFSPRGGVVRVAIEAVWEDGRPWLECRVEDQGAGFPPEDLPSVFDPFFTRRRGGTGLGLSIAQSAVEAHGGRVSAANRPGGGAVLVLRLPVAGARAPGT
jgi:signal transduction histidine kinase